MDKIAIPEATIDWTKPIEFQQKGRWVPARVVATNVKNVYNILILYAVRPDSEQWVLLRPDGRAWPNGDVMVRNKVEDSICYFNVYTAPNDPTRLIIGGINNDQQTALECARSTRHWRKTIMVNLNTNEAKAIALK